jgi:hypothetical protein
MPQDFNAGDFLVFQLEAGFALLRVLGRDDGDAGTTWHLAAYSDFYPDVESAEAATAAPENLRSSAKHLALTDRAFASTQVARLTNSNLTDDEVEPLNEWRADPNRTIHDRSIRLLLGLR